MFLHSRMRCARLARSLSLAAVAGLLAGRGYTATKASLSNYETGKRTPRADLLGHLAQIYQVDVGFFFAGPNLH